MPTTADHQIVEISSQPVALCKLLKIANFVSGGGEAKIVISEGYVLLNDEPEFQKRKKVYENDIIEFNGETVQVRLNEQPLADQIKVDPAAPVDQHSLPLKQTRQAKSTTKSKAAKGMQNKAVKSNPPPIQDTLSTPSRSRRKPISF